MRKSGKGWQSVITLLLAISLMMLVSCRTPVKGVPDHCTTKDEWPGYVAVVMQKWIVHEPDLNDVPTANKAYAARVSYLEGVCKGVNAYRDE